MGLFDVQIPLYASNGVQTVENLPKVFQVLAHSAYRCYCISSSDTVHLSWLLKDQSGSTDPMLWNTRKITWYFLTQLSAFSANFSRVDTHPAVALGLPSVICTNYGRDRQ